MRVRFGGYLLDVDRRELRRGGDPVALEPQVFDLLAYLVAHRDRVVSKDELLDAVWSGRIVSESNLTSRVAAARRAIGDTGEAQAWIRTIARKGVRFVGDAYQDTAPSSADVARTPSLQVAHASSALAIPDGPSIAVLPFTNLGNDPEQDYFSDGLAEDIITDLSRMRWLFVVARNSSVTFKSGPVSVRDVGLELGVRYILEGSIRTAGNRMRLNAHLVEAETGRHLWASRFGRLADDIFVLQDEIAESVVAAIEPSIYAAEGYRAQQRQDNPEAWGLVMRAWTLLNRLRKEDSYAAMALLKQALVMDPSYARAHAYVSWACRMGIQCGWYRDAEVQSQMEFHAQKAKQLDPDEPLGAMTYAFVLGSDGRHTEALAEGRRALEIAPSFALGRALLAWMLVRAGEFEEGVLQAERAKRLNPTGTYSGFYDWVLGFALAGAGRYEECLPYYQSAMIQFPEWNSTYHGVLCAYGHLGRFDLAAPVLARQRLVAPHICLSLLRQRLAKFAHTPGLLEGLRKAGMPEHIP